MKNKILETLIERRKSGRKSFVVLIDPDKIEDVTACARIINLSLENKVDFFFVGGSLITGNNFSQVIHFIKQNCNIPVILFPGSNMHVEGNADAILFLSLISGRNPELLIGQHVVAAPVIRRSKLEVLPTGYILINSGTATTVSYMSNTTPIPGDKPSVAACTAMAGEMLGLQMIYLDAGSGAQVPVSHKTISVVRKAVDVPLIVGGGINNRHKAAQAMEAGADVIVVGNGIEQNPDLLNEISDLMYDYNNNLHV
jgi:phosphoglycerol geranylgeranyltransferase